MKLEKLKPAERLIAEHAVLNLRTLNNACDMAAEGTVLAIAEILAVEQGRELTRKTLQASIDAQVDRVEKKSSPARTCECGLKKAHHGRKVREQVTCAGEIHLSRIYLKYARCSEGGYAADDRLGVAGRYSTGAERLTCLAAASWPYQVSSQRLDELCAIRIGKNTIRNIAQRHGAMMNAWQNSDPEACREYRETDGFTEFTTDGTCVNTLEGWREMKVGIFARRSAGDPATADEWADRQLPSPAVSVAFAAIEASDRFGRRWKP